MKVRGEEVRRAINSLIIKGILEGTPTNQKIIKNPDLDHINKKEFNAFNGIEESRIVHSEAIPEKIIREHKAPVETIEPEPVVHVVKQPEMKQPEIKQVEQRRIEPNKEIVEFARSLIDPQEKEEVVPIVRPIPQSKPQNKKSIKTKETLIIELKNYFSEIVSDNAIRILLNIGNDDVNYIMDKYDYVKSITDHDVVDVLMDELQKDRAAKRRPKVVHEEPKIAKVQKPEEPIREIKDTNIEDFDFDITPDEALELLSDTKQIKKANNQVNMARISSMYKQFNKKK